MSTSTIEHLRARAVGVKVSSEALAVDLADGRTVVAPLAWYPRLLHGTRQERVRPEASPIGSLSIPSVRLSPMETQYRRV